MFGINGENFKYNQPHSTQVKKVHKIVDETYLYHNHSFHPLWWLLSYLQEKMY